jgi:hypothetical protein
LKKYFISVSNLHLIGKRRYIANTYCLAFRPNFAHSDSDRVF